MAFPTGFLEDLRTRVSLSTIAGRKVTWDSRKSVAGKGDYWAPCPFHQEKTPSFHVNDREGYYYCFGCHAKGDAVSFIRETESVGFMEAVEILAREAGVPMPASDPREREKTDQLSELARVMEMAVGFFRLQLKTGKALTARAYLESRRLKEATQDQFEIGYALDEWSGLLTHLRGKSISDKLIVESGLATPPEGGKQSYDRFRDRIMFPIRDARGRCIAFGGRAMKADDGAKYLNSPETPLFDKSRTLYNIQSAREATGKTGKLVVAEGYMDVIALVQAGFKAAVAPLGTAITEHQLQMIWRLCPEPTIALDGDKAGVKAAIRLMDLALPLLEAGKGLRFCMLPEGLDPDDLIRTQGAGEMQQLLDGAGPMVDLLWQRETADQNFDSPERRAALDRSLKANIAKIKDPGIRVHYEAAIRAKRLELFRPATRNLSIQKGQKPRKGIPEPATQGTRASLLRAKDGDARIRESVILAACLNHPELALKHENGLERLTFVCHDLEDIRQTLLTQMHQTPHAGPDPETRNSILVKLMSLGHVRANKHIQATAAPELAETALLEEMYKISAVRGIQSEERDAAEELSGIADEGVTWRLGQASEARNKAMRAEPEGEKPEDNPDLARSRHLQDMIDGQIWVKKRK